MRAHGPQLLTAMIGGLDDGDDPQSLVALEAMLGLAKLLDLVEPGDLRSALLHVAIRIRPFFDSVGWGTPTWTPLLCGPACTPPFPGSQEPGFHGASAGLRMEPECGWGARTYLRTCERARTPGTGTSPIFSAPSFSHRFKCPAVRSLPGEHHVWRGDKGVWGLAPGSGRAGEAACGVTSPPTPGEDGVPFCIHPPLRAPQQGLSWGLRGRLPGAGCWRAGAPATAPAGPSGPRGRCE